MIYRHAANVLRVTMKKVPDNKIQDMIVVEKPQDIRLIFSKKHNMILKLVMEKEMSISEIARALDFNPGSVHYHLKELEKRGFVKQVREEVKGGVVKKYYRSVAKRILLDSPDFNKTDDARADKPEGFVARLIESIEFLGYHLPSENTEDAKELLSRFDKRISDMLLEVHGSGLESFVDDGMVIRSVSQMMLIIRAQEDPELNRVCSEFNKLFIKYE
jgi:DNA-binding transcriptional ArsR family regulator